MKYIKVEWPEIKNYMSDQNYSKEYYFDPSKNCWFFQILAFLKGEGKKRHKQYLELMAIV